MDPCRVARVKFVTLFLLAVLSSCAVVNQGLNLKDPEVVVTDFAVTDVSVEDVAVNLLLNIKNPNQVALKLDEVSYALDFSGNSVTEGVFDKGINIPAAGEGNLVIPLKFKYGSLNNILSSIMKNTYSKEYELTGSAKFGVFRIPFRKKGEVQFTK
jgi:LEA14-like dessication related protein